MIFAFIFLVFLSYLLIRFRLIKVSDKKDFLSILPVFIILGLFFHFLSVFYLFARDKLLSYTVTPIISSMKNFENFKKGKELIIQCKVSKTMPFNHENFVAYKQIPFDDDDFVVTKTIIKRLPLLNNTAEILADTGEMMFNDLHPTCPFCGEILSSKDKFCISCGKILKTNGR